VKPQEDVSVEDVINAFAKEYSSVDVDEIFGPDYFINNCKLLHNYCK
jgi:hypothetical protein